MGVSCRGGRRDGSFAFRFLLIAISRFRIFVPLLIVPLRAAMIVAHRSKITCTNILTATIELIAILKLIIIGFRLSP